MNRRAWGMLLVATVVVALPWRLRIDAGSRPRVLAVVCPMPLPEALDRVGLLEPLRDPQSLEWRGSRLAIIPGANDEALWRRIETGMVTPRRVPSLFHEFGMPVFGDWRASPDVGQDRANLAQAVDFLEANERRGAVAAVVILSCSKADRALSDDPCRGVIAAAIAELKRTAMPGDGAIDYGFLLAVPPQGAPATGVVWVGGPQLKPAPSFRFREIDLLPTLLYLAGKQIPVGVDGAPGLDLFSGERIFHAPIEYYGGGS